MRRRLDLELIRRGLAPSRAAAQELISGGAVLVSGAVADKPARLVDVGESIAVGGASPRFVSRGGRKLDAALERVVLPLEATEVLDAGASTGGFTDCLLQRGVRRVVAVDVGHGQLHERLRGDARVVVRERTNVRDLPTAWCPTADGLVDGVVADLSFISLRTVLPALRGQLRPGGWMVLLAKPQFEAGRAVVDRGAGVVRDPAVWRDVLGRVAVSIDDLGGSIMDVVDAPIRGAAGNVEFLVVARFDGFAPDGAGEDGVGEDGAGEAGAAKDRAGSEGGVERIEGIEQLLDRAVDDATARWSVEVVS